MRSLLKVYSIFMNRYPYMRFCRGGGFGFCAVVLNDWPGSLGIRIRVL